MWSEHTLGGSGRSGTSQLLATAWKMRADAPLRSLLKCVDLRQPRGSLPAACREGIRSFSS